MIGNGAVNPADVPMAATGAEPSTAVPPFRGHRARWLHTSDGGPWRERLRRQKPLVGVKEASTRASTRHAEVRTPRLFPMAYVEVSGMFPGSSSWDRESTSLSGHAGKR